jgi:hypothetical protein
MVFVAYNSKLEKAFIMDEFGTPGVQETQEEEDEMADEPSQQNSKVVFKVEGETVLDEETMDNPETNNKHHLQLEDNGDLSVEARGAVVIDHQSIQMNKSEVLTNDDVTGSDCVKINPTSMENQTCDFATNVVNSESFQYILDNVVLSSSPLVKYPLPYVLTPEGKHCELSEFMRKDIFWSPIFFCDNSTDPNTSEDQVDNSPNKNSETVFFKETHPFVSAVLKNNPRESRALQLLANFRAEGGRIILHKQDKNCSTFNGVDEVDGIKGDKRVEESTQGDTFVPTNRTERTGSGQYRESSRRGSGQYRDCFDPFLHQMIPVMFSSYSKESGNFPRPCITPW